MKPPTMLVAALCLTQLPVGFADLSDSFSTPYTLARGIAHDIRTSWRNFYDWRNSRRRHTLTRRAQPFPGKCQLRLVGPLNTTSPANSHHSSSSISSALSISSTSSTRKTLTSSTSVRPSTTSSSPVKTTSTSTGSSYPTSIFSLKQVHVSL